MLTEEDVWSIAAGLEQQHYTKSEIARRLRNYAGIAGWLTRGEAGNLYSVADTLDNEAYTNTEQTSVGAAIDALE